LSVFFALEIAIALLPNPSTPPGLAGCYMILSL
jgi:hypothetical protein